MEYNHKHRYYPRLWNGYQESLRYNLCSRKLDKWHEVPSITFFSFKMNCNISGRSICNR